MIRRPRKKFGGALGEAFAELWEAVEAGQIVESDGVAVDRTTRGVVLRAGGGGAGELLDIKDVVAGVGISVDETESAWIVTADAPESTAAANSGNGVDVLVQASNVTARSLVAGSNVSVALSENSESIIISADFPVPYYGADFIGIADSTYRTIDSSMYFQEFGEQYPHTGQGVQLTGKEIRIYTIRRIVVEHQAAFGPPPPAAYQEIAIAAAFFAGDEPTQFTTFGIYGYTGEAVMLTLGSNAPYTSMFAPNQSEDIWGTVIHTAPLMHLIKNYPFSS